MWTFTIPKMLRPYFLRHRGLLGSLCRAAYETVQELMASAAIGVDGLRTGMVAVVHPCGDLLTLNPHVHALAPRGGWAPDGSWVPVPFVDERCAELVFRKKVKGQPGAEEHIDALDFLARVIAYIPEPRQHTVFYYAWYSNVSRGRRRKGQDPELATHVPNNEIDGLTPTERQARRRAWARLIKLVYEVNPLTCPRCGNEMRILSVIVDPKIIDKILDHLASKGIEPGRGPPANLAVVES
jgi:hypothetical protein